MTALYTTPFQPINSTAPGFNSTLGSSAVYALESSGAREWAFPSSRSVRLAGKTSTPYSVIFGSSLVVPSTSVGILVPNGDPQVFKVEPTSQSYLGIASSTDVAVNITLGFGG